MTPQTFPLSFDRQDPEGAAILAAIYARGAVLIAYFWQRGFRHGVGREPRTPNHTPIIVESDGATSYFE